MNLLQTMLSTKAHKSHWLLLVALIQLLLPAMAYSQVEPVVVPLIAGQHIDVGTVTVSNTETEILVTYETSGDWLIEDTHLDVETYYGGLDTTKKGNPIPGKFAYHTTPLNPVTKVSFTIQNSGWTEGSMLFIAAHAVVTSSQGTETAWGQGFDFPGNNWGMYFNYTVQAQKADSGVIQFSSAVYMVDEPGRFVRKTDITITLTRTGGDSGDLTVNYFIEPGTATFGMDYFVENETGTIVFGSGEVEKTIVVTILDDSMVEAEETVNLTLDASCCLGDTTTAQILIHDDDVLH